MRDWAKAEGAQRAPGAGNWAEGDGIVRNKNKSSVTSANGLVGAETAS